MSAHHTHVIRNVFVDMLDSIYAVLNSKLSRTLLLNEIFPFQTFTQAKYHLKTCYYLSPFLSLYKKLCFFAFVIIFITGFHCEN